MKKSDEARYNLMNSVGESILRATSILRLVGNEFLGNDDDDDRLSDEIIYFSIESAIKEIEDMRALF